MAKSGTNKKTKLTMAERADVHELYEESVQNVEGEVEFLVDTFKSLRGRVPLSFREDFCGTASAACQWVRTDKRRYAIGVDIDEKTLEWGRAHRVARLPEADRPRVKLLRDDVMHVETDPVDIVVAFNFSYFIFMTRDAMRAYFRRVRDALKDDGLLFLDAFGGPESFDVQKEKTKYDGFTYVWDQAEFEPVTNTIVCHIHFKFPDGSKLKKAFSYRWRLWTLPELRELLEEAGFSKVRVYWEGEDEDGEPNGEFEETATGTPDPAWVAYIVAEK
ncbi:MAG TPA: class I SAM-dependent methyltransferase [Gammaproteobacteria bacterium]|nr:class I SAM-dependent methyltransferase [Gammaproteobacteria bacterium]